jgi:hypothetical protein
LVFPVAAKGNETAIEGELCFLDPPAVRVTIEVVTGLDRAIHVADHYPVIRRLGQILGEGYGDQA